jgi:hypothetical protein
MYYEVDKTNYSIMTKFGNCPLLVDDIMVFIHTGDEKHTLIKIGYNKNHLSSINPDRKKFLEPIRIHAEKNNINWIYQDGEIEWFHLVDDNPKIFYCGTLVSVSTYHSGGWISPFASDVTKVWNRNNKINSILK